MNSLLAVMDQYSSGVITAGQAVKLISTAIGCSTEEAENILKGEVLDDNAGVLGTARKETRSSD